MNGSWTARVSDFRHAPKVLGAACFAIFLGHFSNSPAQAADECGIVIPGGTVTCNGDGLPASDVDPYANGISYVFGGITLNVNGAANTINSGANIGIEVRGADANDIIIDTSDATPVAITTTGATAAGIYSIQSGTGAHRTTSAGDITTAGFQGFGVYAGTWQNANTQALSIDFTGGTITTTGDRAYGLYGVSSGTGSVSVTSSGNIETHQLSYGMFGHALNTANTSTLTLNMSAGSITTNGDHGRGVYGRHDGLGAINITSSGAITTFGDFAYGILGYGNNIGNSSAMRIDMAGGAIRAHGVNAHGIFAVHTGTGNVDITVDGDVRGGRGGSAGISVRTAGALPNAIMIGAGGSVSALSDNAISSIPTGTGGTNVTNDGSVTGYITFGDQNDTFTNNSPNSFNFRNFADTNGDFVRDTENIAVNDFGAGTDTFTNTSSGTLRLVTVHNPNAVGAIAANPNAPTAWNTSGVVPYFAPGSAAVPNTVFGVEQGHFVNLETFDNAGAIIMQDALTGGTGPVAGDVLVITGAATAGTNGGGVFRSNGGSLHLDTVLNDGVVDTSDILVVDSATTGSGATQVFIANAGGAGAETGDGPTDGILVVQVLGASSGNAFALGAPVAAGTYAYDLVQADGQNWYLQSYLRTYMFGYGALPIAMREEIETFVQRVGGEGRLLKADGSVSQDGSGFWMRAAGSRTTADVSANMADLSGAQAYELDRRSYQMGAVGELTRLKGGQVFGGLFFQARQSSMDVSDPTNTRGSKIELDGYGGGATLTWQGAGGTYVDFVGRASRYDASVVSQDVAVAATNSLDGYSVSVSAEAGFNIPVNSFLRLTPQAQIVWQHAYLEEFEDSQGVRIGWDNLSGGRGRLGLAIETGRQPLPEDAGDVNVYAVGNIIREFGELGSATADDLAVAYDVGRDSWEASLGLKYEAGMQTSIYGEASIAGELGGDDYQRTTLSIGARHRF